MLNRIGLPLAKKIKKEKSIKLRKELKMSIERETQQLMVYSQPEKACNLLQNYFEEEKSMMEQRRQKLYRRLDSINTGGTSLLLNTLQIKQANEEPFNFAQEVRDYQNSNLHQVRLQYKAQNREISSSQLKSIQIDSLDQVTPQIRGNQHRSSLNQQYMKRVSNTAQNSARKNEERSLGKVGRVNQKSMFHNNTNILTNQSSKSKINEDQMESISDFGDKNSPKDENNVEQKNSIYTKILKNIGNSSISTNTGTVTLKQGRSTLNEITEKNYSPSLTQQRTIREKRSISIVPIKLDAHSAKGTPPIKQQRNTIIMNDSQNELLLSQTKPQITDSLHTKQSEEKVSDLNTSPKKEVRFFSDHNNSKGRRESKQISVSGSNTSAHYHHKEKQEFQFRDLTVLLRKNMAPKFANTMKEGITNEFRLSKYMTPKKSIVSVYTFESKVYDEIFIIVDQYQKIYDCLINLKNIISKRPVNTSQAQIDFKKQQLVQSWNQAIEICQKNGDFILIFNALKFTGEIYMEFKDFMGAIKQYRALKNFCDEKQRYREKIFTFEQIGICYRLIEDFNSAIKFFRKQLELAWEQKDERAEVAACDQLALTYYYIGDMEKGLHFNDRMMRGKLENNQSVIKRVSKNLIVSKRKRPKYEFYLNPDQLNEYLIKKQEQFNGKQEQLIDFGLSKAYSVLPHPRFLDELPNSDQEDYQDQQSQEGGSKSPQKKKTIRVKSESIYTGPKFQTEELKHLNQPPPYEYLKITDPLLKKKTMYKRITSQNQKSNSNAKYLSIRDYIGAENFKYDLPNRSGTASEHRNKPLDGNQIYQNIIERVKQTDGSLNNRQSEGTVRGVSIVNHLSLLRSLAKNQVIYSISADALEKNLDQFKQSILKRQMMQYLRKWKLGIEFEEICYNI
eukprot:403363794